MSECPGWVCYAEKTHGDLVVPYMSTTRSAAGVMGGLVKNLVPQRLGVPPSGVYHCFISPCYDKKLEASREELRSSDFPDIDCVLATTELVQLIDMKGFDMSTAPHAALDDLFEPECSTLCASRGSSGGYLDFVFRECAHRLKGERLPPGPLPLKVVRNTDFQEISLYDGSGQPLLCFALAYGFRNIQNIIRRIKTHKMQYHFVEVMACPSGCLNGGGQIKAPEAIDRKEFIAVLEGLYHHPQIVERHPMQNPSVAKVIQGLEGRHTTQATAVLRTKYHSKVKKTPDASITVAAAINW